MVLSAYEPSPLDQNVLYSQLAVVSSTSSAFWFWWTQLVPAKREELSKEKRSNTNGSLGSYLSDLKETAGEGSLNDRGFERWLLSDWIDKPSKKKAAALPFLKKVGQP